VGILKRIDIGDTHQNLMNYKEKKSGTWPSTNESVLPDGNGGFTPCPELLTEEEAIRYLRLDGISVDNPTNTLRYYRKKGLLRATQVGKCIRYRRIELERFLDRLTEVNPR